jgi:hypothetical protein
MWSQAGRAATIVGPPPRPRDLHAIVLTCHQRDLIAQQRLARAGWVREVGKMIRWGAPVTEAEKTVLIDYLADRYPLGDAEARVSQITQ